MAVFRSRKRLVGRGWSMYETYILFAGQWLYLYRVVALKGNAMDLNRVPAHIRTGVSPCFWLT